MKKSLAALLIGLATFFAPVALLAQSDGSTGDPPLPVETPQEGTDTTAPVPEPVAPEPQPVAAPTSVSDPAPTPRTTAQQPAPTPVPEAATVTDQTPPPIDEFKELVETAAEEAPASLQPWLYVIAGALAAAVALLGLQEALKRIRSRNTKPCAKCKGTGKEAASEMCATCAGAKTVEEEQEVTAECKHCEGEGEEPCERCEGEGKIDDVPCPDCGGKGIKLDKEGEAVECGLCRGEGEVAATLKKNVPCPDCKGV